VEAKLYSDHLQVAGTVDCIAEYDGCLSVVDFKTSARIKEKTEISSYFIQCAAYAVAFEERTGIPVPKLVIIMGVDNSHPLVFEEKRNTWIGQFKELRQQYRTLNGI
jgi:genome maintenance exonuclease 1